MANITVIYDKDHYTNFRFVMDLSALFKNNLGALIITYGMPTVIAIGCVGNFLSFITFSRKFFAKTSCSFLLKVLCITDTVAAVSYIFSFLAVGLKVNARAFSALHCKISWFFGYAPSSVSAWIEALVCIDRMLNIAVPSFHKVFQKRKHIYSLVAAVVVYNAVAYLPLVYFYNYFENVSYVPTQVSANLTTFNSSNLSVTVSLTRTCVMTSETYYNILSWFDLFNTTLVPFSLMLICTFITLSKIYRTRKNVTKPKEATVQKSFKTSRESKKREQRDLQFAITSISLCLLFFFLNIGIILFNLLSSYDLVPASDFKLFACLTLVVFVADYSIKFFVYLLVNRHFLSEFKCLLASSPVAIISGISSNNSSLN